MRRGPPAPLGSPPEVAFGRRPTRPSRMSAPKPKQAPRIDQTQEEMDVSHNLKRKVDDQVPDGSPEGPDKSKRAAT